MRVTSAFSRMLDLPGASVIDVGFGAEGVVVTVRLRRRRLEGLNSKIRLISHRSFGFHSAGALIALVYLCCAGITIDLPR